MLLSLQKTSATLRPRGRSNNPNELRKRRDYDCAIVRGAAGFSSSEGMADRRQADLESHEYLCEGPVELPSDHTCV